MYGKLASGSAVAGGAASVLPETGGFLHLGSIWMAVLLFVAAFTLISAGLAILRIIPWQEK
ncbi:hypothetical protein [Rubrobacter calidifluminis]|uniref:hypothetical protein n=1 Tax=Rubrobacter calidifluminis TaxID=1392640 RepID=UPI00235E69D4|nr:hypothetical protein [Rubrobacter calidifluminis]